MISAHIPRDEHSRLAALRATGLLGSPDDYPLDCVTNIAANLFDVPIAAISLIDAQRQWFKSSVGLELTDTPRDTSFCGHVVADGLSLVVEDTLRDVRFADNPLVRGPPYIRFYAGHPVRAASGAVLGTLCIIDLVPREFRTAERNLLRELAGLVQSTLAGRASDDSRGFTTEVVATEGESRIDPLLRIWDRRGITAVLEQLLIDPRGTQPSTMLLVAVDDFKRIHTGHGRATADKAMKAACRELRSFLRAPEEIGCFGDDAFLMTLPRTSGAAAERVARRMRDALARLRIDAPAGAAGCHVSIGFTVSIAVQEWRPETGEASASVMRRMRATLAAAKRWGGNTVLLGECLDAVASGTERPPC